MNLTVSGVFIFSYMIFSPLFAHYSQKYLAFFLRMTLLFDYSPLPVGFSLLESILSLEAYVSRTCALGLCCRRNWCGPSFTEESAPQKLCRVVNRVLHTPRL
jgi:hypothetical protein